MVCDFFRSLSDIFLSLPLWLVVGHSCARTHFDIGIILGPKSHKALHGLLPWTDGLATEVWGLGSRNECPFVLSDKALHQPGCVYECFSEGDFQFWQ